MACSVIGAAHRRQGKPCQDASLSRELRSPRGERLLLLAVADGHGGSRYWLSEVGSRLACEQAAAAVAAALAEHDLAELEQWQQQLACELPAAIQRQWLAAIEADWQQRPEAAAQAFAPLTYGSTLGLALLAPGWWGHAGLGDWDLVRLDGARAALISEEPDQGGPAEATASLCLPEAAGHWRKRSRLVPLAAAEQAFTLLLSSDGVRKSCAADSDFLSLCGHLAALADRAALAEALAQITAAGSGDDVSVAIGHWAPGASTAAPGPPQPRLHAVPRAVPRPVLIGAAGLLALGGLAAGLAARCNQPSPAPSPRPSLSAAARASLARESQRLCAQPQLIAANLAQRQPQFRDLHSGKLQAPQLLAAAASDPLGGLIAASAPLPPAARPAPDPLSGSCVELRQALDQQWRLQRQASGRMPPAQQPVPAPPPRP